MRTVASSWKRVPHYCGQTALSTPVPTLDTRERSSPTAAQHLINGWDTQQFQSVTFSLRLILHDRRILREELNPSPPSDPDAAADF